MTKISLITAMDRQNCIGKNDDLPWHISEDLKYFKKQTLDKPMIMGRKTFDSLPGVLPKRTHIVITRTPQDNTEQVRYVTSLDEAIELAKTQHEDEIMVCGGGQIYSQAINIADRLYITHVDTDVQGDTHFPAISQEWNVVSEDGPYTDEKSGLSYRFVTYEKP